MENKITGELWVVKDIYTNKWIVWEVHKHYKIDRYSAKTKKECLQWMNLKKI